MCRDDDQAASKSLTALHVAASNGNATLVERLLESDATVQKPVPRDPSLER